MPWPFACVFHPEKRIVPFASVPRVARVIAAPVVDCERLALEAEPEVAPFVLKVTVYTFVYRITTTPAAPAYQPDP